MSIIAHKAPAVLWFVWVGLTLYGPYKSSHDAQDAVKKFGGSIRKYIYDPD